MWQSFCHTEFSALFFFKKTDDGPGERVRLCTNVCGLEPGFPKTSPEYTIRHLFVLQFHEATKTELYSVSRSGLPWGFKAEFWSLQHTKMFPHMI